MDGRQRTWALVVKAALAVFRGSSALSDPTTQQSSSGQKRRVKAERGKETHSPWQCVQGRRGCVMVRVVSSHRAVDRAGGVCVVLTCETELCPIES